MAGGVGLDNLLPTDSSSLLYPLNLLHPDPHTSKLKKLDRQRLLTIPLYRAYRYTARLENRLCYVQQNIVSHSLHFAHLCCIIIYHQQT